MEIKSILHINHISSNAFPPIEPTEIYCKKKNAIVSTTDLDCSGCPMFAGNGQGTTVECRWDDVAPSVGDVRHVGYGYAKKELFRVAQLNDLNKSNPSVKILVNR